ncbi:hypothetical protein ACIRVF_21840 [Kitasatospora sp. NPDC101157]
MSFSPWSPALDAITMVKLFSEGWEANHQVLQHLSGHRVHLR